MLYETNITRLPQPYTSNCISTWKEAGFELGSTTNYSFEVLKSFNLKLTVLTDPIRITFTCHQSANTREGVRLTNYRIVLTLHLRQCLWFLGIFHLVLAPTHRFDICNSDVKLTCRFWMKSRMPQNLICNPQ